MIVYIQWTRANTPQDWQSYDIRSSVDWRRLPKKDEPTTDGEGLKLYTDPDRGAIWVPDPSHPTADDEGWISDLCIAGIHMSGADHHYLERSGPRFRYVRWNDDEEWTGDRHAQEYSFGKVVEVRENIDLAIRHGLMTASAIDALPVGEKVRLGFLQPDISLRAWAEDPKRRAGDWSGFIVPPEEGTLHGVWMPDDMNEAHETAKTFAPDSVRWAEQL